MKRWKAIGMGAALVTLAASAFAGSTSKTPARCCVLPTLAAASDSAATQDSVLVLDISGMTCDGCAIRVKKALSSVKEVKDASVSYSAKEARVRIAKPTAAQKQLVEAVKKAGFKAQVRAKKTEPAKQAPPSSAKPSS